MSLSVVTTTHATLYARSEWHAITDQRRGRDQAMLIETRMHARGATGVALPTPSSSQLFLLDLLHELFHRCVPFLLPELRQPLLLRTPVEGHPSLLEEVLPVLDEGEVDRVLPREVPGGYTWRLHVAVTHGGYTWRLHMTVTHGSRPPQ